VFAKMITIDISTKKCETVMKTFRF